MTWFWQRRKPRKAVERVPAPAMEMVRRVEFTVEEYWIAEVVQRPKANSGEATADIEQRIVSRLELPPSTKGDSRVK